ncbi:MAG: hypothetical protein ACRDO9_06790, partial [Gaiellales bacterium]
MDESEIGSAKVLPPEVPTGTAGGRTFLWSRFPPVMEGETPVAGKLLLELDITSVLVHWLGHTNPSESGLCSPSPLDSNA